MVLSWYRRFIARFLFRKLFLSVALSLFIVFLVLGFLLRNSFYQLLLEREDQLLEVRTEKFREHFSQTIKDFQMDMSALYVIGSPNFDASISTYQFFLPENIPATVYQSQVQDNKIRSSLTWALDNTTDALDIMAYRLADSKIYYVAKQKQGNIDSNYDFGRFFSLLPHDYNFPFFRIDKGFFKENTKSTFYIIVPIFDYKSIRNDHFIGYIMISLDTKGLFSNFNPNGDTQNRLIIRQGETILFDSSPGLAFPLETDNEFLQKQSTLSRYNIEILGIRSKQALKDRLSEIELTTFLILSLALLLCLLLLSNIQRIVVKRLKKMVNHFGKFKENPFTPPITVIGQDEISHLMTHFNMMTEELQEHIQREYVTELQKKNAEFYALKMQINPHFLYNTLESMRMQAFTSKQISLAQNLFNMGQLLRWLIKSGVDVVPIEEEIRYTQAYINLLTMGKSNEIEFYIESELDLDRIMMLKFCMQPLIENAIFHGRLEAKENPVISIQISRDDTQINIEIFNNGEGIELEKQLELQEYIWKSPPFQHEHMGLKNVHERLQTFYSKEYGLFIKPTDPALGFTIIMKIPFLTTG